jgi:hypothetical protein
MVLQVAWRQASFQAQSVPETEEFGRESGRRCLKAK